MPLSPDARFLLDAFAALPALGTLSPQETRDVLAAAAVAMPEIPMASVENRTVTTPGVDVPVRVYTPTGATFGAPGPVIMFFHGGGWVVGSVDSYDRTARRLADDTGCVVVSVDYRLAPEHRYPAPLDDCYAATEWVVANAGSLNVDPDRLAVSGDSAGGNLAAAVTLMARERRGPAIAFQLLIYPVTGTPWDGRASYRDNGDGYLLTKQSMEWFTDHYVGDRSRLADPYLAPILATDLTGLPPAHVITAQFDPLRDEGEAYAARLLAAGVPTTVTRYDGQIHGFFTNDAFMRDARRAQLETALHVRAALG